MTYRIALRLISKDRKINVSMAIEGGLLSLASHYIDAVPVFSCNSRMMVVSGKANQRTLSC